MASANDTNNKKDEEPRPDLAMAKFKTFLNANVEGGKELEITEIKPGVLQAQNVKPFCGVTWFGHITTHPVIPTLQYVYNDRGINVCLQAMFISGRKTCIDYSKHPIYNNKLVIFEVAIDSNGQDTAILKADSVAICSATEPLKAFLL
jgi:hypothetical protein